MITKTVGTTGQMFTSVQAAWDDLVLSHNPLTDNAEIVLAAQTHYAAGVGPMVNIGGLTTGSFRVTFRPAGPLRSAILDANNQNANYFACGTVHNITVRGLKMRRNNGSGAVSGSSFDNEGLILEQNDIEAYYTGDAMGQFRGSATNPVIIRANYVHGGDGTGGAPFSNVGGRIARLFNGAEFCRVIGNTFRKFDIGLTLGNYLGNPTPQGNVVKDNIFIDQVAGDAGCVRFSAGLIPADTVLDNNLYFSVTAVGRIDPTQYVTLSAWQTASGRDANSLFADPLLTSLADPHLLVGSPAIGAGSLTTDAVVDFDGDTYQPLPAIGADQPFFIPAGNEATNVVFVNANTITCTTPAHVAGLATVNVTNPDSQNGALANGFTFNAAPIVNTPFPITPSFGPAIGGTAITITGSNFQSGAIATMNGVAVQSLVFVNTNTLTGITPPSPLGTTSDGSVNVFVQNPDGQGSNAPSNVFTYVAAPTVSAVFPASGINSGGTPVTVTGTHFHFGVNGNATFTTPTVMFGGFLATSVIVLGEGSLTCDTPAHASGSVDVVVTNSDGQSGTLVNGYMFALPAPTITSVVPNSGSVSGGEPITVNGTFFQSGATVQFGTTFATSVFFVNANQLTCVAPAGAAGPVNVVVTNPDAQVGALFNGYTYVSANVRGIRGWTPDPIVLSVGCHKIRVHSHPTAGYQDLYIDGVYTATRTIPLNSSDSLNYKMEFTRTGPGNGIMYVDRIVATRES